MSQATELMLWSESIPNTLPANLSQPAEIAAFAKQLTVREKTQVVKAFNDGSYEMATSFVWGRAMAGLKRELGTLGLTFLGELLGRTDIKQDDNVLEVITEKEAIRLAEELGVISHTEGIRLRHSQELVSHFSQRDSSQDDEPMEMNEAITILLHCVKSILGKPSIQVARRFAEFRKELETESLNAKDTRCKTLVSSPYFFRRLAVSVLLAGIRSNRGAKLEHCLSNLNALLPLLWPGLRESEKWQVGGTYAQVYAEGLQMQTVGVKQALLKVKGFDYVPENLRSETFIKAAESIIRAHEGMNNFYTEEAPTLKLENLGTVIPAAAIGICFTALLCVRLGNFYGVSWAAKPIADRILKKQASERWAHYLEKILPGEIRILEKLIDEKPRSQWVSLIAEIPRNHLSVKERAIKDLLDASIAKNDGRIQLFAERLMIAYYGKGDSAPF
jgi:hypothetical protein